MVHMSFNGNDGVQPQNQYFIALATAAKVSAFGLPKGWNSSSENINSAGSRKDGSVDGVLSVKLGNSDIANIDFGINKKPTADNKDVQSQLNPGLNKQVHCTDTER